VEEVLRAQADALTGQGVRVETLIAPKLATLYFDPDLIRQVVLNVVLNAVQAMPAGGTLRLEVRRVRRRQAPRGPGRRASDLGEAPPKRAPGWVVFQQVRITDSGPGIPRGVLAKLFDPFFTTKPRGTGLGLSISQTILHEHGGTIEVASREGRGTTVLLNFPLEKRHGERRESRGHTGRTAHAAHR
jgi:signal transduction histidine kinase